MDLRDLKIKRLGIDAEKFGRIFSFVDYANVNYWYEKDQRGADENILHEGQKLIVDIEKLGGFRKQAVQKLKKKLLNNGKKITYKL